MVKIAFLSVGNGCRSQMAEGFAKAYGKGVIEAYSAGTNPVAEVNSKAIKAMKEKGIDISDQKPKTLDDIPVPDMVISMSSEDVIPRIPGVTSVDWGLADPKDREDSFFNRVRDIIAARVRSLIEEVEDGVLP